MDLHIQGTAKGKIQSQSERKAGSHPKKQGQVRVKGQGKVFGGIIEPTGQKQDLNVGYKPNEGKVQDKVYEQRVKGLLYKITCLSSGGRAGSPTESCRK